MHVNNTVRLRSTPGMEVPSTPGTPLTPIQGFGSLNTENLPFTTSYDEYQTFIVGILDNNGNSTEKRNDTGYDDSLTPQTPVNSRLERQVTEEMVEPTIFEQHIELIAQLENRLNYRFLELDAKLRFLRLLTTGKKMSDSEMEKLDFDIEEAEIKIQSLNEKVDDMKKTGRNLRKKLNKCLHQSEIKRCIEGRPVLEHEIGLLQEEIAEFRGFFKEHGLEESQESQNDDDVTWAKKIVDENLIGFNLLTNNLNQIDLEIKEMENDVKKFEVDESHLDEEQIVLNNQIEALQRQKLELQNELKDIESHVITDQDSRKIAQLRTMSELVKLWESI